MVKGLEKGGLAVPASDAEGDDASASSDASGEAKRRRLTVVRGQIPLELEELLTQPFSKEERDVIFTSVGLTTVPRAPPSQRPIALWVFGPPAAGKTSVSDQVEEEYFGSKSSAVSIDGSHVRNSHTGFQRVLKHGFENQMIHADAWTKLKATKYVETLKEEIFFMAVENRQNIKICDAAQKLERAKNMLKSLEDADFELHAMCLWVPEVAIRNRGQHRTAESGRVMCSSSYASSTEATLAFAKNWDEKIRQGDARYKSLVLLDNTPRRAVRISLEEFEPGKLRESGCGRTGRRRNRKSTTSGFERTEQVIVLELLLYHWSAAFSPRADSPVKNPWMDDKKTSPCS